MIKLDIITNVAEKTGVPKMKAEAAVEALFEAMKKAMQRGERIELRGFGVFVVKPRKRGIGRCPLGRCPPPKLELNVRHPLCFTADLSYATPPQSKAGPTA